MCKTKLEDIKIGQVFPTNQGGSITIKEVINYRNVVVEHNDDYKHTVTVKLQRILTGEIKNPYFPNVHGIGFIGTGKYSYKDKTAYQLWQGMITRSYSQKTKERQPKYANVTTAKEWHNFQNFAEWFYSQSHYMDGYNLDKDILKEGNKEYSPSTCCLVPQEINKLFINRGNPDRLLPTGVQLCKGRYQVKAGQKYIGSYDTPELASQAYQSAKREYVLEKVDTWKNKVDPKVIEAMLDLANNNR